MTQLELWTQSITAQWPPCLSFYDKKLELLHGFQDEGVLLAFKNQDGEIGALLGDRDHQIEVEPNRLSMRILQKGGDIRRIERAARSVVTAIAPPRVAKLSVSLQYVAPLSQDYDEARVESSQAFLGLGEPSDLRLSDSALRIWDWAVLLEGENDRDEASFQMEFGIVDAEELPERLAREVGQIELEGSHPDADHWENEKLPEVALFADCEWTGKMPERLPPFDGIMSLWSHAIEDAEHLLALALERVERSHSVELGKGKEPSE
jgi:hypothetical protein